MLSITNHQRYENQNHSEIPHICQNDYRQNEDKQQILTRMWRTRDPPTQLVGMQIGSAIVENNVDTSQKTKNRIAI